ncbi:MAG: hypothetical protein KDC58_11665 [Cyclobacteriaceae bacterium]|nr:hypothetical protein [Cyclobacteriaceae bacterium]
MRNTINTVKEKRGEGHGRKRSNSERDNYKRLFELAKLNMDVLGVSPQLERMLN